MRGCKHAHAVLHPRVSAGSLDEGEQDELTPCTSGQSQCICNEGWILPSDTQA